MYEGLVELLRQLPEEFIVDKRVPPSVIRNNRFDADGLVKRGSERLVPVYVASGLIFNFPGNHFLDTYFYPALEDCGILPLCPFKTCGEYIDMGKIVDTMKISEEKEILEVYKKMIGVVNYEILFPRAKFLINIAEGSPTDEGAASETAHFADMYGKVMAVRSDFRLAENRCAYVNPAVQYFVDACRRYEGKSFIVPDASEKAYKMLFRAARKEADSIRKKA